MSGPNPLEMHVCLGDVTYAFRGSPPDDIPPRDKAVLISLLTYWADQLRGLR